MRLPLLAIALLVVAAACSSGDAPKDAAGDASTNDAGGALPMADGGPTMTEGGGPGIPEAGHDAGTANAKPTISSWLGTNVSADVPRVDIAYQLAAFDGTTHDANGYPAAGTNGKSSTDLGFVLPTGTYKISFKGTGTVAVSGIGTLGGAWSSANGEQRNTIAIVGTPGVFGRFLTIAVTNTAGQSVTDLHVYAPGFDYDATATFLPPFLALIAPFRALRFMDWEATNGNTIADWADRPTAAHFGHSKFGEPYEHILELVNETGKDAWLTIPEHATADFIAQMADFVATGLDFGRIQAARDSAGFTTPFQLILENSNETWNQGFTAYATFLAAANADPTHFDGVYTGPEGPAFMAQSKNLMKVGQYEGARLVQIGNAFRAALAAKGKPDVARPVLSGWALGTAYSDVALRYIQSHYGEPKSYVSLIAHAPYFATADDTTTGSLDALFTAMQANIAGQEPMYRSFAALGTTWGIPIAGYEGGQSLNGATNQPIKHLAQHDKRMYDAYTSYLALWKKVYGDHSLFMHFSLADIPGRPETNFVSGFWGSVEGGVFEDLTKCGSDLTLLTGTETIDSVRHRCPKYRALAEQVP